MQLTNYVFIRPPLVQVTSTSLEKLPGHSAEPLLILVGSFVSIFVIRSCSHSHTTVCFFTTLYEYIVLHYSGSEGGQRVSDAMSSGQSP